LTVRYGQFVILYILDAVVLITVGVAASEAVTANIKSTSN
jgi:hypothetical protein